MNNCKVCGKEPKEVQDLNHKTGVIDFGVRCVADDHYIHVIGASKEEAREKWLILTSTRN